MQFKKCCVCGLELPLSVLTPIKLKYQGKIIIVPICDNCKEHKQQEAREKKNENYCRIKKRRI